MAPPPRTIYIVPAGSQSRPRVHMASGCGPAILSRPQVATRPAPVFRPIATPGTNQHSQRPPKKQQFHDDHGYAGAVRQISQSVPTPNPIRVQPKTFPMTQPIQSKKRKLDFSEERAVVPETYDGEEDELVDIAEVYQLLGEHFGPDEYTEQPLPRKRERLTNLSKEEKLHRRKLKNRVAAQTARDRKKERSIRLEKAVRALLHETTNLRADNAKMQRELQQLRTQQQMLQSQGSVNANSSNTLQNVQFANNTPQPILSSPSSQSYLPEVITDNVGGQIQHSPRMGVAGNMVKVEAVETFGSAESISDRQPCERVSATTALTISTVKPLSIKDEDLPSLASPQIRKISSKTVNRLTCLLSTLLAMSLTSSTKSNDLLKTKITSLKPFLTTSSVTALHSKQLTNSATKSSKMKLLLRLLQHQPHRIAAALLQRWRRQRRLLFPPPQPPINRHTTSKRC